VDRVNRTGDLGYGLARDAWGKGLATEAARAVVDYGFSALGLAKVWARTDPRNAASVRVLEKLGMRREGLLRSHVIRWGERADRAYYGLLREEWEAEGARGTPRPGPTGPDASTRS
jgi:RimJ/RimL family protein N-acetyltransferase